jgi:hypothetical protein
MRKIILALAVILIAGLSSGFANTPVDINKKAAAAFHADFKKAKDVKWVESPKYIQVQFNLDDKVMYAYYSPDGRLICQTRNILTTDLPAYLRNDIKKNYGSYWVSELFQLSTDQGVSYYVRLEDGEGYVTLSAESGDNWRTYKMPEASAKRTVSL